MTVNTDLQIDITTNDRDAQRSIQRMQSSLIRLVGAVSSAIAAINAVAFPIRQAAEFEKELFNIQKTTGFTDEAIKKLGDELQELSKQVNVSAVDLAKIAAIAGQLGIASKTGEEGVARFVETASRLSSVLDIDTEKAARTLAQIGNVFGVTAEQYENISATVNELSNTTAAAGNDLIDIINRIGDAGKTLDFSQAASLAAFSKEVAVSNEVAGTSFAKVFNNAISRAERFAEVMNITTEEWVNRVQSDGVGAMTDLATELVKLGPIASNQFVQMNIGAGRIQATFNKFIADVRNGSPIMNKIRTDSVAAFRDGTSSIKEQENVLRGVLVQLDILKNTFTAIAGDVGEEFLPAIRETAVELQNFLKDPKTLALFKDIGQDIAALAGVLKSLISIIAGNQDAMQGLFDVIKLIAIAKVAKTFINLAGSVRASTGEVKKLVSQYKTLRNTEGSLGAINTIQGTLSNAKPATKAAAGFALIGKAIQDNLVNPLNVASIGSDEFGKQVEKDSKKIAKTYENVGKATDKALFSTDRLARLEKESKARIKLIDDEQRKTEGLLNQRQPRGQRNDRALQDQIAASRARSEALKTEVRNEVTAARTRAEIDNNRSKQLSQGIVQRAAASQANVKYGASITTLNQQLLAGTITADKYRQSIQAIQVTANTASARISNIASTLATVGRTALNFLGTIGLVVSVATVLWSVLKGILGTEEKRQKESDRVAQAYEKINEETQKNKALLEQIVEQTANAANFAAGITSSFTEANRQLDKMTSSTILTDSLTTILGLQKQITAGTAENEQVDTRILELEERIAEATQKRVDLLRQVAQAGGRSDTGDRVLDQQITNTTREIEELGKVVIAERAAQAARKERVDSQNTLLQETLDNTSRVYTGIEESILLEIRSLARLSKALDEANTKQTELDKKLAGEKEGSLGFAKATKAAEDNSKAINQLNTDYAKLLAESRKVVSQLATASGVSNKQSVDFFEQVRTTIGGDIDALVTLEQQFSEASERNFRISNKTARAIAVNLETNRQAIALIARNQLAPALAEVNSELVKWENRLVNIGTANNAITDNTLKFSNDLNNVLEERNVLIDRENQDSAATGKVEEQVKFWQDILDSRQKAFDLGKLSQGQLDADKRTYGLIIEDIKRQGKEEERSVRNSRIRENVQSEILKSKKQEAELQKALEGTDTRAKEQALSLLKQQKEVIKEQILAASKELEVLDRGGKTVAIVSDEEIQRMKAVLADIDVTLQSAGSEIATSAIDKLKVQQLSLQTLSTEVNNISNGFSAQLTNLANQFPRVKSAVDGVNVSMKETTKILDNANLGAILSLPQVANQVVNASNLKEATVEIDNFRKAAEDGITKNSELLDLAADLSKQVAATGSDTVNQLSSSLNAVLEGTIFEGSQLQQTIQAAKDELDFRAEIEASLSPSSSVNADVKKALEGPFNAKVNIEINNLSKLQSDLKLIVSGGNAQGFSTGGSVWGAGTATSDSIPAWLSNGEYVIKASSVKKFGTGFFNMLNSGMIPRFAEGGAVSAGSNGLDGLDLVQINIDSGNGSASVFSDRNQVSSLNRILRNVQRGTNK